jgi:hypothetical protein
MAFRQKFSAGFSISSPAAVGGGVIFMHPSRVYNIIPTIILFQ